MRQYTVLKNDTKNGEVWYLNRQDGTVYHKDVRAQNQKIGMSAYAGSFAGSMISILLGGVLVGYAMPKFAPLLVFLFGLASGYLMMVFLSPRLLKFTSQEQVVVNAERILRLYEEGKSERTKLILITAFVAALAGFLCLVPPNSLTV